MCHLYQRICTDVMARSCLLLKELIIPRQGLLFACRIPLAEQILLAIQEMLQTTSVGLLLSITCYQHHRNHK